MDIRGEAALTKAGGLSRHHSERPLGRSKQYTLQEEEKCRQRTSLLGATVNKDMYTNPSVALEGYLLSGTGMTAGRVQEGPGEGHRLSCPPIPSSPDAGLMGILRPIPWLGSRDVG